jgi:hypothetical protein
MRRRPRSWLALAGGLLLAAGCADRGVASGPASPPGAGTWVLVWTAAALAVLVLAALIGGVGRGRWTVAVAVLALQAAAVLVGGAVLAGLAIASWPLANAKAAGTPSSVESLVRISVTDGDPRYFSLMLLVVVVLGPLLVALLAITARFARHTDPIERAAATSVLLLELVPALYGLARIVQGHRSTPAVLAALHLPILVVAIVTAWPRHADPSEPPEPAEPQPSPAG